MSEENYKGYIIQTRADRRVTVTRGSDIALTFGNIRAAYAWVDAQDKKPPSEGA